ncbi:glycosyltransferase [Bacillus mangrovi]|uniref:Glycosyltransferase n=1 Tax=Metabacillus mangrovi TaxID=1491830 RepID=A0A7X2S4K8_9BACI|nr:glycosyltransferase family 2 protein [Metabacillus mangrovi]MTH53155.1 glycosyltransferase [Metabacillus mangrovi]
MLFAYSSVLLILLLFTIANSFFMPKLKRSGPAPGNAVSILVPLRNEERNVPSLITMLKKLTYPNVRFFLLDDQSEDQTYELLKQHAGPDKRFTLLKGEKLPQGWSGKVHACHLLSRHAETDLLLFLDADVRLQPDTLEKAVSMMRSKNASLLTGFPRFPVTFLLEKWLVPMQHYLIYVHLPLYLANYTGFPAAAAAHGSFMLFKREDYLAAGGHAAIKDSLVDDVHLARKMKATGKRVILANVTEDVTCYMYRSGKEAWNGFKKNIFPGFGRSLPAAAALCLYFAAVCIFPGLFAIYGAYELAAKQTFTALYFVPYVLSVLQKMYVDWRSRQSLMLAPAIPLSAAIFIALMAVSIYASFSRKGYDWKGRSYE